MTTKLRKIVGVEFRKLEGWRHMGVLSPDPRHLAIFGLRIRECVAYRDCRDGNDDLYERLVRPSGDVEWYEVG